MKKFLLSFLILLMFVPFTFLYSQENVEEAGQQAKDGIDYLIAEINRLKAIEGETMARLDALTAEMSKVSDELERLNAENVALGEEIKEYQGLAVELESMKAENAELKGVLSEFNQLLRDLAEYFRAPVSFLQRIERLIQSESTE